MQRSQNPKTTEVKRDDQHDAFGRMAGWSSQVMNQRWLAGFMQAFLLGAAVVFASRDVERTMNQQPVRPEQNAALMEYFEKRQQQQRR